MALSFDFAVVKIVPDPLRDEALNAAIVVLRPDRLQVHVTSNPERLRAIAPTVTTALLDELAAALKSIDQYREPTAVRLEMLRSLPGITISEPGSLHGQSEQEIEANAINLSNRLLSPIRGPLQMAPAKATALTRELSRVFTREHLLGRGPEALGKHKVIRNHPISSDGKLRADFVAKNSAYHVTETVDLRSGGDVSASRLKDIAVAAVTLDEAKRTLGRKTRRYFVYAATAAEEKSASGLLGAAGHHSDHVFNFSSKLDRSEYFDFMLAALRNDLAATARLAESGRAATVERVRDVTRVKVLSSLKQLAGPAQYDIASLAKKYDLTISAANRILAAAGPNRAKADAAAKRSRKKR